MVWDWVERGFSSIRGSIGEGLAGGVSEGWIWGSGSGYGGRWHVGVAVGVTAMAGIALAATIVLSSRSGKSKTIQEKKRRPCLTSDDKHSTRKILLSFDSIRRLGIRSNVTNHFDFYGAACDVLTLKLSFANPLCKLLKVASNLLGLDGKENMHLLHNNGKASLQQKESFVKEGLDQSIRAEVWPFLLGVYELNSSEAERNALSEHKRNEYKMLRKRCRHLLKFCDDGDKVLKAVDEGLSVHHQSLNHDNGDQIARDENNRTHTSTITEEKGEISHSAVSEDQSDATSDAVKYENDFAQDDQKNNKRGTIVNGPKVGEPESSSTESSSEESESFLSPAISLENRGPDSPVINGASKSAQSVEDFTTWQRIIRLDAVRANAEWAVYAPAQASVSDHIARQHAVAVGLKDYDHLDPFMIYHAARLVAVLEAYALHDPEIGYCQGMSDLLSPIVAIMEEDDEAFWCFVGFMKKARHNFRLDEVGIRRQLRIVSKIIKFKDPHLYRHLEKLQAADCFFVYRMVVVLFRRELGFEQTLCLWEVMWADQSAIRAGFGKSAWARIRLRAPPTDDLLLYAIAACVLQRRKLIIERYCSMEEILRECNNMAGQLDVWKLLDDAHDLVVTLHDKIS
ncbi:hypothetical protein AXF42_Ash020900 [Apostasia shenzhenica]|uniref:Rab-GAP TBC domain-containing protein n=1 Tax=Apostasia shenzhenica TaxID=1088818 RepID=A0A2I0AD49_9ASPA|nr:hypothetical protein AXF42_Ash020900 [Apostasia shenzhenica]